MPIDFRAGLRAGVQLTLFAVARNPQTFHQALLLIANLTRLAPDAVLHNVMPVFTFMGSNVFHRDDAYSFRVVKKVGVVGYYVCLHIVTSIILRQSTASCR